MEWLDSVKGVLEAAGPAALGVMVLATIIVRFTPSKKDDSLVGKISGVVLKVCSWLPTLGVNPETKKLKEALKEAQDQLPKE